MQSILKWEMATQTDPVQFASDADRPREQLTVHDLVTDLHDKSKSLDIHALTLKQVEVREETLQSEFEAERRQLQDRIALLHSQIGDRDKEVAD